MESATPYVAGAGIAVSDPAVSERFYRDAIGLTVRADPARSGKVLGDARGHDLVLMDSADGRSTHHNPVKLVFVVPDARVAYQTVLDGGGTAFRPPAVFAGVTIGLAYDPDGYLVELYEVPAVTACTLAAVGIGVSDLDSSAHFYSAVVGLRFVRDIPIPGFMQEKELRSYQKKGLSLVLMHYEDQTRVYRDIPATIMLAGSIDVERDIDGYLLKAAGPR